MARPQKEIDWNLFEQLCALQCIQTEIASCLKIDQETLANRVKQHYEAESYSDIYKRFSETGKCSLRRHQFVLSKKNASMAIWLGKVWLGQKDPQGEENKDLINDVREAVREIRDGRRSESFERSILANKSPLSYQGLTREQDKVPHELGSGNPMEGEAQL